MILNNNTLDKISNKMIITMKRDEMFGLTKNLYALSQYFIINNKIQLILNGDISLKNKKAIYEFNSIGSKTDKNSCEYSGKPKYVTIYSQRERDMLIKELYSLGLACQYPSFLRINDNYYFLNELSFTAYDKERKIESVFEKYEELDCFMLENLYGLEYLIQKGYKIENKQYKLIK